MALHPATRRPAARRGPQTRLLLARLLLAGLLLAVLPGLAGCLDEASDKDFRFDNPQDPAGEGARADANIVGVFTGLDQVLIVNQGQLDQDMNSWTLVDTSQTDAIYNFSAFTLSAGAEVWVHVGSTGDHDSNDLFQPDADSTFNIQTDSAFQLRDDTDTTVSSCDNNDDCWR